MRARRAKSKSRYVPKVVFRTAFASVVPLCVAPACGGSVVAQGAPDDGATDTAVSQGGDVACNAFCTGVAAPAFGDVAAEAYGGGVAEGGFSNGGGEVAFAGFGGDVAETGFTNAGGDVAADAFGGDVGVADASFGNGPDATKLDGSSDG
jgi:hypothetical protein